MDIILIYGASDAAQRAERLLKRRLGDIVVRSEEELPESGVRVVVNECSFNGPKEAAQFIHEIATRHPIISS